MSILLKMRLAYQKYLWNGSPVQHVLHVKRVGGSK